MLVEYRSDLGMKVLKCHKCYNIIDCNYPDKHYLTVRKLCGTCTTCEATYLTIDELSLVLADDVHLVLHDDLWSIDEIEEILTP